MIMYYYRKGSSQDERVGQYSYSGVGVLNQKGIFEGEKGDMEDRGLVPVLSQVLFGFDCLFFKDRANPAHLPNFRDCAIDWE